MVKFLHEYQNLLLALVKIAIMLGFFVNMAPLLVFAERRQSALIQDRIGPNRAVITLPGVVLKGVFSLPALAAAAGIVALCYFVFPPTGALAPERGFWMAELAVFFAWSHALLLTGFVRIRNLEANALEQFLAKIDDPRWIFYTGLIAHGFLLVSYVGLTGNNADAAARGFALGGPALLAFVLAMIGAYLGYRIPSGKVSLRAAGLFHSIADALKAAFKEDFVPAHADRLLHALAPLIALFPALVTFAVIPFGDTLCFENTPEGYTNLTRIAQQVPRLGTCAANGVELQIADLNVGILFIFAIAGTGIIGAAIAGSSSDNKFSLFGGLRAASQMVSYEVAMGLSLAGAFMIYSSPRLGDMVRWQGENTWGIFVQPLAFFLFFAAAIAEHKRIPFDAPEGESEIVAGYFLEYSSFKWLMFYTGEYIEIVTSSALLVTIFLGGWNLPFLHRDGLTVSFGDTLLAHVSMSHLGVTLLQVITFFAKVVLVCFGQIFIRWTLPRFRYDQIMAFGWKLMLPTAIANLVITGLAILLVNGAGPGIVSTLKLAADITQLIVVIGFVVLIVQLIRLLLAPVDRLKFYQSTAAQRAANLGGVKTEPMQA